MAGKVMMQGHLEAKVIHVQRHRVRKALHVVDHLGVEQRKHRQIWWES